MPIETLDDLARRQQALMADYAERRKALHEESRGILERYFQGCFAQEPRLKAIRWPQYTPYFNDGSPCVFSVYPPDFLLAGLPDRVNQALGEADASGAYWFCGGNVTFRYDYFTKTETHFHEHQALADFLKQITRFLFSLDEELLRDLYDDHVEVIVYPDRVETRSCSHD